MTIFRSRAMDEAGLPLGTPLNKYQPEWPLAKPPRWMIRRDYKENHRDPMLPWGSRFCWCSECGLYFNSSSAFEKHLGERPGAPERYCISVGTLRRSGWTQSPRGHWRLPNMTAESLARLRST